MHIEIRADIVLLFVCLVSRRVSISTLLRASSSFFFFFKDPAPSEIYPLSLHDALPIFALRIERVEREIEVMLGRFAGVDGAAEHLSLGCLHGRAPSDDRELRRRGHEDTPTKGVPL